MVVSPRCLEQRLIPPTPSHHQCEGRPPALQASRATRASNSAVASAACLEGRPGPVTPSTFVARSNRLRHPAEDAADQAGAPFELLRRCGLVVGDAAAIK